MTSKGGQKKAAFLLGNVACAEGALAAGCRFFAAYPITPASEIGEHIVGKIFQKGGSFIQTEDEIAAIASVIGSSWGGLKAMTATSGPGISLMAENIGLAVATETPCVIVNVQRGGPSTGSPSLPLQADMIQARHCSHGDYEIIAYAPSSPQEMFDFTILAFNAAEKYRTPVFILSDALVGHMNEQVILPGEEEIRLENRKIPASYEKGQKIFLDEDVAPMPVFGRGLRANVTGSTHLENGDRSVASPKAMDSEIRRLNGKITRHLDEITMDEAYFTEDAEVLFYAYGSISRGVIEGVRLAREQGIKAGCHRPITVWPFSKKRIRELAGGCKKVVVCENNMGQMYYHVAEALAGMAEVRFASPAVFGMLMTPREILEIAKEEARR